LGGTNANSCTVKEASYYDQAPNGSALSEDDMSTGPNKGWIFVTGATAGIGRALVAKLLADGRDVIAAARDPRRIAPSRGGGRLEVVGLDLAETATIVEAAREVERIAAADGLAALVNMAGIIVEGPLEAITPDELRRQFEVNVFGPYALAQTALPLLKRTHGTIVNIGAVSAYLTPPFYGPIAASKAALSSLSDAMRMEFAPFGIRVVLIQPGRCRRVSSPPPRRIAKRCSIARRNSRRVIARRCKRSSRRSQNPARAIRPSSSTP
jgi:NAD(P)-dependent dehydrogenase (short-subunit alcohol dehydrogenase family)